MNGARRLTKSLTKDERRDVQLAAAKHPHPAPRVWPRTIAAIVLGAAIAATIATVFPAPAPLSFLAGALVTVPILWPLARDRESHRSAALRFALVEVVGPYCEGCGQRYEPSNRPQRCPGCGASQTTD
ncbi:MAG: hypothetical protein VYC34_09315 [Planctomycetota bacterium]|nr:hypothetical protein [Planctomycetota bacterium]